MLSSRMLGQYGRLPVRHWCSPRLPQSIEATWKLNAMSSRSRVTGTSSRGFRSTPHSLFKKGPADDNPGDDFEFELAKRRHERRFSTEADAAAARGKHPPRPASAYASPLSDDAKELSKHYGFLFDCDGVLHLGSRKIDSAKAALRLCQDHEARYLFLTNGGGNTTEKQKAVSLQKKVGTKSKDLVDGRVIQSHTPLSTFKDASKLDKTVYITSLDPDRARDIAHSYGFRKVVTAADILELYGHIYPFEPKIIGQADARRLPGDAKIWHGQNPMKYDDAELKSHNYLKIDHIFVFNDPRDWSLETQIIHDMLVSHKGYLGTLSNKNGDKSLENEGWQQDQQPRVWISNLDLVWKTEHPLNRFGTGAFVHAFRGVWRESTGHELHFKYMGKPSQITYEYAHECLQRGLASSASSHGGGQEQRRALRRVYMIGDNPESDVRGALEFKPEDGTEYVPILVRTGVWQETEAEPQPRYQPAVIVDDVLDAVVWAMRQEGIDVDREMVQSKAGLNLLGE